MPKTETKDAEPKPKQKPWTNLKSARNPKSGVSAFREQHQRTVNVWHGGHVHEISPGVFLTNEAGSREKELLLSLGVKGILNSASETPCCHPSAFTYLHLSLEDNERETLPLNLACDFIAQVTGGM